MMKLELKKFLSIPACKFEFTGHRPHLKTQMAGVSIDSRTLHPGELYIALKGENHDGHDFVTAALEKQASAAVVERSFWQDNKAHLTGCPLFVVENTLTALQKLANFTRKQYKIPVLALTGTNGKTTTKEMIAAVLSQAGNVCKTQGNLNNHIGVPLTLLTLDKAHDFLVVEMGTNHFGEIARLCEIAEPEYGLITNVGHGHTEFLRDLQGVAQAKLELFDYLRSKGWLFVNLDDPVLAQKAPQVRRSTRYGFTPDSDVVAEELDLDEAGRPAMRIEGMTMRLNLVGMHNLTNALAAVAVGKKFGIALEQIKRALETVHIPSKRMEVTRQNDITILNDCYNANPESTLAALRTLAAFPAAGKKLLALGDMLELGEHAEEKHAQIGKSVREYRVNALFAYGPLSRHAVDACQKHSPKMAAHHFNSKQELITALRHDLAPGDLLLVKGSRGMKMEEVIEALKREG